MNVRKLLSIFTIFILPLSNSYAKDEECRMLILPLSNSHAKDEEDKPKIPVYIIKNKENVKKSKAIGLSISFSREDNFYQKHTFNTFIRCNLLFSKQKPTKNKKVLYTNRNTI